MSDQQALAAMRAAYGGTLRLSYAPCAADAAAALKAGKSTATPKCLTGIYGATPTVAHSTSIALVERVPTKRTYVDYILFDQHFNSPADYDAFVSTANKRFGPATFMKGETALWCDSSNIVQSDITDTHPHCKRPDSLAAGLSSSMAANPYIAIADCTSGRTLEISSPTSRNLEALIVLSDSHARCSAADAYKAALSGINGVKAAF
jgi:hypothetical protein